jgi:two-component system response regulator RegA
MLIVDDDDSLRGRLSRALSERGFQCLLASSVNQATEMARAQLPEYAVVDLRLPGDSGLELISALKALDPATKVVVLSGYGSIATAVEAVKRGAIGFVQKPADADDILRAFGDSPASDKPISEASTPSLARAEWEHIHRVLADCAGNISEAARRLGLHRRSLQRKLQKRPPAQ